MPRDDNRERIVTTEQEYENLLEKRELKRVRHFSTPVLKGPTPAQRRSLQTATRVWSAGDTLMKLANEYYGNVRYWYIIAWYNFKPTDAHFQLGDTVYIPTNLSKILSILRSF
jgi:nucleoid-associated protein YgaU